ncbi:dephospho-CoA kinase [Vibrio sp. V27_P1S3P104]|uniref:dephospho-CoA kinase n=1 Tax=unclassified Vibrio TaxID=2614977 RepID=UPI0013729831|nr:MULTISPECIES: dephospho-CoA kinase [unclassified Vibrio]NAW69022.1 dephospho-CoA kinase [Vibrio sp. V28_P6S34P95]NAX04277.1 dephospho-CoA kinase [Vibrio sp. V30_P3S12P165]NAX33574.1 dephospho-CoA kinase [Vibrio sp. V29_P1S30P107]NAX36107.1 dephospho-CoA kinase [Vibrio sp. V27_P1S3P104]NAX41529.1 dephospho-CoA kinase [Vibrio sp. V26_P1S5P106]
MPLIVGLTGGIASGKTTVANLFQTHFSIDIVDADIIAREVVAQGSQGLAAIIEHFGPSILHQDGSLNRAALRERIFAIPAEKKWLDQRLHPLINQRMCEALQKVTSPYALLVVPLLIENQLQSMVDRILVVDVDEQTQIKRTQARDKVSKEQVLAILSAQASRAERLAFADDVIKNSAQNQKLLPQITKLHQKYLAISSTNQSE